MQPKLNDLVHFTDRLQDHGSYWKYLKPEFAVYLQSYLSVFESHRREIGVIPSIEEWKQLPFGSLADTSDWKWRRQSLSIIQNLIQNNNFDCTLEIGSWNGWLTKHLSQISKTMIAVDYFICPFDGIGNLQDLEENILAVQCNLEEIPIDFKPRSFDLIVLNHHLSYMNNPVHYIQQLILLLKPNGMIISIGNTFFKNPKKKIKTNAAFAEQFKAQYGMNLHIQPIKGYMNFEDLNTLQNAGFQIKPYKVKKAQNIYSKLNFSAPFYTYLIYQHTT